MKKKVIVMIIIVIIVLMLPYCRYIYRNHAVYDFGDNTSKNQAFYMDIYIGEDTGNKIDGYKDVDPFSYYLYLESSTEIEYIEPSENIDTMEIYCSGQGTHDLKDFTEYYPNLEVIKFNDCNFPDDFSMNFDNVVAIEFINNTNVDYSILEQSEVLETIVIEDVNLQSEYLPELNDSLNRFELFISTPMNFDLKDFSTNIERIELNTTYEGDENQDTIYGLENYPNLISFRYDNAQYITRESYDYVIENDIYIEPYDLEIIE